MADLIYTAFNIAVLLMWFAGPYVWKRIDEWHEFRKAAKDRRAWYADDY